MNEISAIVSEYPLEISNRETKIIQEENYGKNLELDIKNLRKLYIVMFISLLTSLIVSIVYKS